MNEIFIYLNISETNGRLKVLDVLVIDGYTKSKQLELQWKQRKPYIWNRSQIIDFSANIIKIVLLLVLVILIRSQGILQFLKNHLQKLNSKALTPITLDEATERTFVYFWRT